MSGKRKICYPLEEVKAELFAEAMARLEEMEKGYSDEQREKEHKSREKERKSREKERKAKMKLRKKKEAEYQQSLLAEVSPTRPGRGIAPVELCRRLEQEVEAPKDLRKIIPDEAPAPAQEKASTADAPAHPASAQKKDDGPKKHSLKGKSLKVVLKAWQPESLERDPNDPDEDVIAKWLHGLLEPRKFNSKGDATKFLIYHLDIGEATTAHLLNMYEQLYENKLAYKKCAQGRRPHKYWPLSLFFSRKNPFLTKRGSKRTAQNIPTHPLALLI